MNAGCDEERNPNSQICHDCQNDLRNVTLATGTAHFNTDDLFCDELSFRNFAAAERAGSFEIHTSWVRDSTPLVDAEDVVMDNPVVAAAAMLDLQTAAAAPRYHGP